MGSFTENPCDSPGSGKKPKDKSIDLLKFSITKHSARLASSDLMFDKLLDESAYKQSSDNSIIKETHEIKTPTPKSKVFNPFDAVRKNKSKPQVSSGFNLLRTYKPGEFIKNSIDTQNCTLEELDELSNNHKFLNLTLGLE